MKINVKEILIIVAIILNISTNLYTILKKDTQDVINKIDGIALKLEKVNNKINLVSKIISDFEEVESTNTTFSKLIENTNTNFHSTAIIIAAVIGVICVCGILYIYFPFFDYDNFPGKDQGGEKGFNNSLNENKVVEIQSISEKNIIIDNAGSNTSSAQDLFSSNKENFFVNKLIESTSKLTFDRINDFSANIDFHNTAPIIGTAILIVNVSRVLYKFFPFFNSHKSIKKNEGDEKFFDKTLSEKEMSFENKVIEIQSVSDKDIITDNITSNNQDKNLFSINNDSGILEDIQKLFLDG